MSHLSSIGAAAFVALAASACAGGAGGGGGDGFSTDPPANSDGNCSSGAWWTNGNQESPRMHPGRDCISCHAGGEGPDFTVAGTVMGAYDDENDCEGVSDVTVELIDKDGASLLTLSTNEAGNFHSSHALPADRLPFTVRLTKNGDVREMSTPQTSGNCMQCHTAEGANDAPGRVVAP